MLRRHLRQGGSPVSACAGFDPDRASAFLEGALGGSARARYEAHLAGCPACRRHVIELSRLSQLAMQPDAMPVASSRWLQWKSSLGEKIDNWINPPSWRLNWRVTGTVLAGCAIFIFALTLQPVRQPSSINSKVSMETSTEAMKSSGAAQKLAPPAENIESSDKLLANSRSLDTLPSPTDNAYSEPAAGNAQVNQAQVRQVTQAQLDQAPAPGQSNRPIPTPRIEMAQNMEAGNAAQMRALEKSEPKGGEIGEVAELARNYAGNERVFSPKEEQSGLIGDLEPVLPPPTKARKRPLQSTAEVIPGARRAAFGPGTDVIAENREKMRNDRLPPHSAMPRMTPNPEYNPMQSGFLDGKQIAKLKNEKSQLQTQKNSIWVFVMDYMKSYLPWRRHDYFEKSLVNIGKNSKSDGKDEANEDEAGAVDRDDAVKDKKTVTLVRHLRGKIFRHIRGVWIDDQYEAELSAWRLTSLRRGSEAYNRVLDEDPQLKEFFDLGPIIIVWHDRIYRVTER